MIKDAPLEYPKLLKTDGRKSGSSSIIDEDDLRIISILCLCINLDKSKNPYAHKLRLKLDSWSKQEAEVMRKNLARSPNQTYLTDLENLLKISRKSILEHLKKLERFSWIKTKRSSIPEEYKQKVLSITDLGVECFELLCKSNTFFEDENGKLVINLPKQIIS